MRSGPALRSQPSGSDLASALALELRSMRDLARSLPIASAGSDRDGVMAAQGQDLLEQTLDELASFLERSADKFGDEPLGDLQPALSRIGLAALAERLVGGKVAPAGGGTMAEGELELL